MAKQIEKYGIPVAIVAMVAALIVVPLARSQSSHEPDRQVARGVAVLGDPQMARTLRSALGLGPTDLLPALAGNTSHHAIITKSRQFLAQHEAALTPLINNYRTAQDHVQGCLIWGQDPTAAYAELDTAIAALRQGTASLLTNIQTDIPAEYRSILSQVMTDAALDPELRGLSLSPEQRAAVLQAQRARDRVLATQQQGSAAVQTAQDQFVSLLNTTLTSQQQSQLASHRQLIHQRLPDMIWAETEQN